MILKNEILEIARQTTLAPHVVEKDYVLSWILAGISENKELSDQFVFKGGTCLKKCYFNSYRMSEDLDFTLKSPKYLDQNLLKTAFSQVSKWVYNSSGITLPTDRMSFDFYENPRGKICCEGRLFYSGPIAPTSPRQTPRIKLDLTADERVVEEPVLKSIDHIYSDSINVITKVPCYSYLEIFAEKIRALSDRTRPRDLYDVIHFFRRPESRGLSTEIKRVLSQKCDYKGLPFPNYDLLESHKQFCATGWSDQLAHQLPVLPSFELFWEELIPFFSWLSNMQHDNKGMSEIITVPNSHTINDIRSLGLDGTKISLLDKLQFAAVNHLCSEIIFVQENQKKTSVIEAYSLRMTDEGSPTLHAKDHLNNDKMELRIEQIQKVNVTSNHFKPTYRVDFIPKLIL